MGFFDSLLKSTVRRVVNNVVDNAVDNAFKGNNNNNQQPYQQQTYQQPQRTQPQITYGAPITILQPNLAIEHEPFTYTISPCIITNEDDLDYDNVDVEFLKSTNLFEKDSGAAEIQLAFLVADNEDEAYNDDLFDILPHIYIGNDLLYDDSRKRNDMSNAVFSKVENHPCIHEKQEFDLQYKGYQTKQPYILHYVVYNFYASTADRAANRSTSIALEIPVNCAPNRRAAALQALDLFVTSFKIK